MNRLVKTALSLLNKLRNNEMYFFIDKDTFLLEKEFQLDVAVLGITKENPYFDVELTDSKSEIVISSAMAQKFGLGKGDVFTVYDEQEKIYYAFTVRDIAEYSVSFYIFMDIDRMRALFGESRDYYNMVFASEELDIEPGRIYGVAAKADIEKAADVFAAKMQTSP